MLTSSLLIPDSDSKPPGMVEWAGVVGAAGMDEGNAG
jgi:hypothetical protein